MAATSKIKLALLVRRLQTISLIQATASCISANSYGGCAIFVAVVLCMNVEEAVIGFVVGRVKMPLGRVLVECIMWCRIWDAGNYDKPLVWWNLVEYIKHNKVEAISHLGGNG